MKNIDQDQPQPNVAFTKLINDMGGNKAAIGRRLRNEDGKPVHGQLIGQYMAGRQKPKNWFYRTWKAVYGEDISHLFSETETEANVSRETIANEDSAQYRREQNVSVADLMEGNKKMMDAHIAQAESNRLLTEAHNRLTMDHHELIQIYKEAIAREQQETQKAVDARWSQLLVTLAEIGIGKLGWKSKQEGLAVLGRLLYADLKKEKEAGTHRHSGKSHKSS